MGDEKKMNRQGGVILRNVIFILILFTTVIALMTLFVQDTSDTYNNDAMYDQYDDTGIVAIGGDALNDTRTEIIKGKEAIAPEEGESEGMLGAVQLLTGTLTGAATILGIVLKAPDTISDVFVVSLSIFNIPDKISQVIGFFVTAMLYGIIIFVLISAALRGGKV